MSPQEAFQTARHKARYGHRDWVVFTKRDGSAEARVYSREAVKAAMLAVGTSGHFSVIEGSSTVGHRINWALGCLRLRNAKYFGAAS